MVRTKIKILFLVVLLITSLVNQPTYSSALEVGQLYDYSHYNHYIFEYKDFNNSDLEYTLIESYRILGFEEDIVICKVFAVAFVLEHRMLIADKDNYMNFTEPTKVVLFTNNASGYLLWFWNITLFEQYENNLSINSTVSEYELIFEATAEDIPVAYYYFKNNDTWLTEDCKYNFSLSVKYDDNGILEYHRTSIEVQGEGFNKTEFHGTSRIYLTVQTSYSWLFLPFILIMAISVKTIQRIRRRKANET